MNQADLESLILEGESVTLEFKEGLSSNFSRELVALTNTRGGLILLGVRDDGAITGIQETNDLRARIQDIARNCDPPIQVSLESVGSVVVVHVSESSEKPVQCREGFYWRQGAVSQKLSREEIRTFFQREGAVRFDLSLNHSFHYPDDFDPVKFNSWIDKTNISRRSPIEEVLVNIEAAEKNVDRLLFRNVGILFFAKDVRRFFNQAYITCVLFRGSDRSQVLDRKDFDGGIVSDIEESLRFIARNTRTAYKIEGLRRVDVPQYPMTALREAITNAVMHRDWFYEGANVFVEIFGDRVEIVSPGGLPPGVTAASLGVRSVRRNPLVADLLHRIGFIEKAGTGIARMREAARDLGSPEPMFQADDFFTSTFLPAPGQSIEGGISEQGFRSDNPEEHSTPQVPPKYPPSTPHVLLVLSAATRDASREDLQTASGLRDRKHFAKAYLQPLLDAGWIEMTIPERPRSNQQRYRITPAGEEFLSSKSGRAGTP